MIYGLAAAVFLGLSILFLGIAVTTGIGVAWIMASVNALLFVSNMLRYGATAEKRP